MSNPIDGPAPVLRPGPRCPAVGHGVGPDRGTWNCGAQPGHGGLVHVVYGPDVPEVWISWPTAEALDADADATAPEPDGFPLLRARLPWAFDDTTLPEF